MAQNCQVHYDHGKNCHYIITTFEMFKPDKWGNTYFFVDYDYNLDANKNVEYLFDETRWRTLRRNISFLCLNQ